MGDNGHRIEDVYMRVSSLKKGFGNPRKITKAKLKNLRESLESFGNFGVILIDEHDNIIAGSQRAQVINDIDPDTVVHCKRLIGYSESELKSVNVRDNTHSGEWDFDLLAEWFQDLEIDLDVPVPDPQERVIKEMLPIPFEKYDYVLVVCRSELDYVDLKKKLGIADSKVVISEKKRLKARAVWYDEIKWS